MLLLLEELLINDTHTGPCSEQGIYSIDTMLVGNLNLGNVTYLHLVLIYD